MSRKISVLLGLMAVLVMALAAPAQALRPLRGEMALQFNLAAAGPSEVVPGWVGTIDLDGQVYGMAFFNTGTGKPFAEQPADNVFFAETWVIYETLDFSFNPDGTLGVFEPGRVLLSGDDRGITNVHNSKYHMNGQVLVAEPPFEQLLGRNVHMSGDIVWYDFGAPHFAPGTFRVG